MVRVLLHVLYKLNHHEVIVQDNVIGMAHQTKIGLSQREEYPTILSH